MSGREPLGAPWHGPLVRIFLPPSSFARPEVFDNDHEDGRDDYENYDNDRSDDDKDNKNKNHSDHEEDDAGLLKM